MRTILVFYRRKQRLSHPANGRNTSSRYTFSKFRGVTQRTGTVGNGQEAIIGSD